MNTSISQYLKQKKLSKAIFIAVAVLLVGVGYVAYTSWFTREEAPQNQQQTQNSLPTQKRDQHNHQLLTEESNTSDWKIYRNDTFGFSLKFPKNWIVVERKNTNSPGVGIAFFNEEETINLQDDFIQYYSSKNYPIFYYKTLLPDHDIVHPPHLPPYERRHGVSVLEPEITMMIQSYPEIKIGSVNEPPVTHLLGEKEDGISINGRIFSVYSQGCYECYDGDSRSSTNGIYAFTCNRYSICIQLFSKRSRNNASIKSLILDGMFPTFQFLRNVFDNIEHI